MTEIEEIQNKQVRFKGENSQVKVLKGDVIKFGRVRFRVRELVTEKSKI